MQELIKKAGILIEALPYIQKFSGKTVVIKYGGNAMINEELKNSVMEDITLLKFIGLNPIVVHGGGPDISKALNERGVKSKFVNGLRVTDDITMQTACHQINISLLSLLSVPMRTATAITSMQIRLRRQLRRLLRRKNLFCLLMLRVLRIKTVMLLPKYIKMKYTK